MRSMKPRPPQRRGKAMSGAFRHKRILRPLKRVILADSRGRIPEMQVGPLHRGKNIPALIAPKLV